MPPKTVLTEEGLKKILREERENNKAEQENHARQFQSSVIAVRKEVKALADAAQPLGPPRSGATRIVGARAAVQAGKWSLGLDPITLANVKGLTSAWGHAAQCTQFLAGSRLNDLLEGAANADSNYNLLKGIVCFCCANELVDQDEYDRLAADDHAELKRNIETFLNGGDRKEVTKLCTQERKKVTVLINSRLREAILKEFYPDIAAADLQNELPTRREDQLKPFDDVAHETDAKHAICEAFFDPEEEAGEEGGETYYDFPSTKLVQAAFSVTEHFQLGLTKEALALMMAAFDGFKEQPKMVQAKEDQDGNALVKQYQLRFSEHKAYPEEIRTNLEWMANPKYCPSTSLTIRTHQGEAQQQRDQADRLSQPHDEEPPAAKKRKKGKSASVALNTSVAGAPRF